VTFKTVVYEKVGALCRVTLNRPRQLNAYNVQMRDELFEVLSAVRDDDEARVLVLRGAGRAFCAGADLTEFGTAPSPTVARQVRFARDVWAVLEGLEIPTVVALHGFVFGSGLELALFCDLRIAAEGTQLGLPEVRLGMIPAAGGTQTLPRACGQGRALELLLTGRRIDAAEAHRLSIVSRLVAPDRLDQEVEACAGELASFDAAAVRAVKRAVRGGSDLTLEQGIRLEARLAARLRNQRQSKEAARG
jgi:enoyl-CoA hydratase/carnithine racemase